MNRYRLNRAIVLVFLLLAGVVVGWWLAERLAAWERELPW